MSRAASSAGVLVPAPLLPVIQSPSSPESNSSPKRSLKFLGRAERSCVSPMLLLLPPPSFVEGAPPPPPPPAPLPLPGLHKTFPASAVLALLLAREPAFLCALATADRGPPVPAPAAASADPAARLPPPRPPCRDWPFPPGQRAKISTRGEHCPHGCYTKEGKN